MAEEFKIIQMYNSTGAEVFPKTMAEIVKYDDTTSVKQKIEALVTAGGEPNVLTAVKWNGEAFEITDKAVDIYSKVSTFVSEEIGKQIHMSVEVVEALPTAGEAGVIYLKAEAGNIAGTYTEYIWTGSAFEQIGTTATDLTNYATKDDVATAINNKVTDLNLAQYATVEALNGVDARVQAIEAKVPGYDAYVAVERYSKTEVDGIVDGLEKTIGDNKTAAENAIKAINESAVMTSGITADKVGAYDAYVTVERYSKDEVDGIVDGLEADIKTINESAVMTSGITAELVGKISANEGAISTLNGNVTDLGNNKADKVITAGGKTLSVLYFEEVTA